MNVRGDSLRDLYAKTLALVGLGVLAGVGALFDYWPTGVRVVPVPDSTLALPEPAYAAAALIDTEIPVAIVDHMPRLARAVTSTSAPMATSGASHTRDFENLGAESTADEVVLASIPGQTRSLPGSAVLQPLVAVADSAALTTPELPVEDFDFVVPATSTLARLEPAAAMSMSLRQPENGQDDDGGFLGDALRKTRTSLVKTGARTGASIVDAVRVVGGAVRRALPN